MNEQELKANQKALMKEYEDWHDLQGEFNSDTKEWHDCEQEKQRLSEECDGIRRILFEMGCCE